MIRGVGALLLLVFVLGLCQSVSARPDYLVRFQADPFRRAEVDGCGTCHVNQSGGGARNDFGNAFDAAAREITPMLRATFPQHFAFESATLPDGSTFAFSDPQSKFAVFEREKQRVLVDLSAISAPAAAPVPAAANRMSVFVTSKGPAKGGELGGLAGADRLCQDLATAVGAGDRTWRAYLSTSFQGKPAVNAGDRIGNGPWYNAKGILVAKGSVDLHTNAQIRAERILTEKGEAPGASGAAPAILTGSLPNGTAAVETTCQNWTSAAEGEATVGDLAGAWNSARTVSCAIPQAAALYCFAAR
jgi:hypothetical protein